MKIGSGKYQYELVEGWWPEKRDETIVTAVLTDVVVDSQDRVHVFRRGPHPPAVLVFDPDGHLLSSWGEDIFDVPHALWIKDDFIFCTDCGDHTVRKFTLDGKLLMTLGTPGQVGGPGLPFNQPTKAVLAPMGDIIVSDGYGQYRVHRFSPEGRLLFSWGERGSGPGQFALPHGVVVDRWNRVLVSDRENNFRTQVFDIDGKLLSIWNYPGGSSQNLYIVPDDTIYAFGASSNIDILNPEGEMITRLEITYGAHAGCVDSHGDIYRVSSNIVEKFAHI